MLAVGSGQWVKSVLSAESRVLSEESENSWQLAVGGWQGKLGLRVLFSTWSTLSAEC